MTRPVCYVNNIRVKYTRVCVSIDGVWPKQTYSKDMHLSSFHGFPYGIFLSQIGNEALAILLLRPRLVARLSKMVEMGARYMMKSRLSFQFCSLLQGRRYMAYLGLRMCVAGSNIRADGDIASQKSEILMSFLDTIFGILLGSTNEPSRRYSIDGSE